MNPEEVPSRPSWEIGKQLVDQLLAQQRKTKGRYPEKVAFTLNSFATFQDYGVMESQILYLLGVRPKWDDKNLVADVELIPATELGRPRIDVFLSSGGYYRDMLPTRMRLLDKAIRMVAALDEPENRVRRHSLSVRQELQQQGLDPQKAEALSKARIFGVPPGQIGGAGYYYLVERSGQWGTRKDLMDAYLSFSRYVYTDGMWGQAAPEAYNRQLQGSEVLLRSWSDRTRSPLIFPALLVLCTRQQPPLVFRLRHPGSRVPDPLVRSAVEQIRSVRLLGRLQHQDFLCARNGDPGLVDPGGRFELADRIGHFLERGVTDILALDPARGRDAEQQSPAPAVEEAAQRLHPRVKLAGRFLKLDVFPLALALGDKRFEFRECHALRFGHVEVSHALILSFLVSPPARFVPMAFLLLMLCRFKIARNQGHKGLSNFAEIILKTISATPLFQHCQRCQLPALPLPVPTAAGQGRKNALRAPLRLVLAARKKLIGTSTRIEPQRL